MKFLKALLFPFAWLFGVVMVVRNFMYDRGYFKSEKFDLPVISVGNLTVGGTGKTPHVEYLLHLLQNYRTATLSRGYKRNTRGFLLADDTATATNIGDEPFQYFLDFPVTTVAVCEKRAEGIKKLQNLKPQTEVIILDDAFQHRAVTPTLNLLITDFYRRFDTDFMLPVGLLREPRSGARRANAVIVSKCPEDLSEAGRLNLENGIKKYVKTGTPIFFTAYAYDVPVGFGQAALLSKKIILVTGIANADPLLLYLRQTGYQVLEHFKFPDHHLYTAEDLAKICRKYEQFNAGTVSILTTRKDAVKLNQPAFARVLLKISVFYVPIRVKFLDREIAFKKLVQAAISPGQPL